MSKSSPWLLSRRDFLRNSAVGLAGLTAAETLSELHFPRESTAALIPAPQFKIEPRPVIKVLRWGGFIAQEEDIWFANTRRWEKKTGGRVITDFVPFHDVRPKSSLEATLETGHDIIVGWFDDPHLYPEKLIDLSEIAIYLGGKYGGWYPVCEQYGRQNASGRWIALPLGCSGGCINYRKSHLQEAGFETMPEDISGFIRCCQALKAKGYSTGFALGRAVADANAWCHWWLWSFGGKSVEKDGKTIAINSQETLLALDSARELHETMVEGVENWLDPDNNRAFLAGNISVTNNGTSILAAARKQNTSLAADMATMNFPIGPLGQPAELSGITQALIFRHSLMPNAAKDFLLFMFEEEQYTGWINGSFGYITQSLKTFHELPVWHTDPQIEPYGNCMERMLPNGFAGPLGRASAAAMSDYVVVEMIADVCLGRKSAKSAALRAEKRLRILYD